MVHIIHTNELYLYMRKPFYTLIFFLLLACSKGTDPAPSLNSQSTLIGVWTGVDKYNKNVAQPISYGVQVTLTNTTMSIYYTGLVPVVDRFPNGSMTYRDNPTIWTYSYSTTDTNTAKLQVSNTYYLVVTVNSSTSISIDSNNKEDHWDLTK